MGAAFSFLTRIPVGRADQSLSRATPWFPWVGVVVGLVVAAAYSIAYPWMPSALAAVIAVTAGIMLTGALHEDGLADSVDAIGSGATGEEALRILRDPHVGTYGGVAVTVSLVWRVVALASLSPVWALAGMVLAHGVGRSAAVVLAGIAPPARRDGLGHSATLVTGRVDLVVVALSALLIAAFSTGPWAIPILVLAAVAVWSWRSLALNRFGGITGDVLGACEQLVEMLALAVVAGAAWRGWSPWWQGQF